jgi:DNA polymerase I-like protein with 3'-5' exonuclease and polymerase domains
MAVAFFGQGLGADFVQAVMLRFDRERNIIPVLNVHDMLMFEVPKEMPDDKAREFISLMQEETKDLPGLAVPGKAERGPNYGETKPL